jgi:hypothetical protein
VWQVATLVGQLGRVASILEWLEVGQPRETVSDLRALATQLRGAVRQLRKTAPRRQAKDVAQLQAQGKEVGYPHFRECALRFVASGLATLRAEVLHARGGHRVQAQEAAAAAAAGGGSVRAGRRFEPGRALSLDWVCRLSDLLLLALVAGMAPVRGKSLATLVRRNHPPALTE